MTVVVECSIKLKKLIYFRIFRHQRLELEIKLQPKRIMPDIREILAITLSVMYSETLGFGIVVKIILIFLDLVKNIRIKNAGMSNVFKVFFNSSSPNI